MKTILKSLFFASLLLANMTASAQNQMLESLPTTVSRSDISVQKSLSQERDVHREGLPIKSRCDIYTFTLTKKQSKELLDRMIQVFENANREDPYCYGINTLSTGNPQNEGKRNLIVGEDMNRYVTIGEQYGNYVNVNILDANDTTKTHRYAYALEWKEDHKGNVFARYIITYAKIPSAFAATKQITSSFSSAIQDPSLADAVKDMIKNGRELWGEDFTAEDLICDDNILFLFSKMKEQYCQGENEEFNAISIYLLCKRAREFSYFKDKYAKVLLKQLKDEVRELVNMGSNNKAVLYYLQQALLELEQIK